jgi:hypothetical protein
MKNLLYTFLLLVIFSCSPYKKVTVSASEYMTNNMRGSTHADVIKSLGTYTKRTDVENGYKLLFDYSFTLNDGSNKTQVYQKQNSGRPTSPSLDPKKMNIDPRSNSEKQPSMAQFGDTKMAKFLEVSFDNNGKVQSVKAEGFPDSVKYIPKK